MKTGSNIVMINYANGNPSKLILEYGRLTVEGTKKHATTYFGQQTSKEQKSIWMYHCIFNSIAEAAHTKIVTELTKYTVQGTPVGEL